MPTKQSTSNVDTSKTNADDNKKTHNREKSTSSKIITSQTNFHQLTNNQTNQKPP